MALSTFKPSRELFDNFGTEASIFNQTLGDANLTPFGDIVDGVNQGLQLANNIQTTWDNIGPEGVERRRIAMETAKTQAEIQKHALSIKAMEAKHKAILDEDLLLAEKTRLQSETLKGELTSQKRKVLSTAYTGLSQIYDPDSLHAFLSDPQYSVLIGDPEFGKIISAKAGSMMVGATPEQQVKLIQLEAMGSGRALSPVASTQASSMIGRPTAAAGAAKPETRAQAIARQDRESVVENALQGVQSKIPKGAKVTYDDISNTVIATDPLNPTSAPIKIKLDEYELTGSSAATAATNNTVRSNVREMVRDMQSRQGGRGPVQDRPDTTESTQAAIESSARLGAGGISNRAIGGGTILKGRLGIESDEEVDSVLGKAETIARHAPNFGPKEEAAIVADLKKTLSNTNVSDNPEVMDALINNVVEETRKLRKEFKHREKMAKENRKSIPIMGVTITSNNPPITPQPVAGAAQEMGVTNPAASPMPGSALGGPGGFLR